MKIEQILMQPVGQKFNAGTLTIKTTKKTWEVNKVWWNQVVFMDETGEIPADVKIGTFKPLHRAWNVKIIIAEVREAEYLGKPRKILMVDQYKVETQMVDDYYAEADKAYDINMAEVRGKIRHGLCCAYIASGKDIFLHPKIIKEQILEIAEFIMTGKIE